MRNTRFFQTCAVIIISLALVVTSGCQLFTQNQSETTTESSSEQQTEIGTGSPLNGTLSTQIQISTTTSELLPSIADVVAAVKPSVVAINTEAVTLDFFGRYVPQEGAGSGWIISSDGLIITNNHVIADAQTINVTLSDGRSLPVDVSKVVSDAISDLAVLKVNATGLPAVKIGDSNRLRVGDWVVAIGNSLGEGIRATQGIISRQDVTITDDSGQEISGLIETDAAINPGNSGGPLVNMAGEVIGITNAKTVATGVEGVGYAIGTNEAIPIIQELINKGYVTWPYLGVNTYTVDNYAVRQYNLNVDEGVLLTYIEANSPAAKAGLQAGDVVVKFNGQAVATGAELIHAIHEAEIGQPAEIIFWRGNEQKTISAILTERPR